MVNDSGKESRPVAGVILAGGASTRMGSPKQLLLLDGRPLLQHALDAAASAALDPIVIVLGYRADEIGAALTLPPSARIVRNPDWAEGLASSLRCGLAALEAEVQAAVMLLSDQPGVAPGAIGAAVRLFRESDAPVVRTSYRGQPGHPVVLSRSVWPEVMGQSGDLGARDVLAEHPEWVVSLELDEAEPDDVDTPDDYERLTRG